MRIAKPIGSSAEDEVFFNKEDLISTATCCLVKLSSERMLECSWPYPIIIFAALKVSCIILKIRFENFDILNILKIRNFQNSLFARLREGTV